ncbi:LysR family transcriptional regulator [Actinomadura atramentaria]|uniref:LysR family transcriptional regulator n=1 Tax=Actinomadura atramentaria TaxID=1990 RepID=UPI0003787C82|nr:LysR substrate-binding domain-containing protein [Actinomadura atramentaria]
MNLVGHLRCFVAVAEELHFGRAAERLGMAQPPLSQRIQRLERELGIRLFERSSRRVEPTPAGLLLLEDAREIIARADRVHALADRVRRGADGALRAGLPADLGGGVVAALIAAFGARRPGRRLDLREIPSAEQAGALADGSLDVGVLRHPCDTRGLDLGPMLDQRVGVLLPEADPVGDDAVALADLAGRDLVLFPREEAPGSHDEWLAACRRHGYDPPAVREARHPQFALGLVLAGTAVALAPDPGDAGPGVVWRPLDGDPIAWRTSCAWRADRADDAVADFAAVATAVLRREARMTPFAAPRRRVVPRPSAGFLA